MAAPTRPPPTPSRAVGRASEAAEPTPPVAPITAGDRPSARRRSPVLVAAALLIVLGLGGAVLLLSRRGGSGADTGAAPPAATGVAASVGPTQATAVAQGTAPATTTAAPSFALSRASEIAQATLPAADQLGRGWRQSNQEAEDTVQELGDLFDPDVSPACQALARRVDTLAREDEPFRAGFAGREYSLDATSADALDALVVVRIGIYRETAGLDTALAEAGAALSDPAAPACIEARWSDELTAAPITPFAVAPQKGLAAAFALKAKPATPGGVPDENRSIRLEIYLWRYGNAVVLISAAAGPVLTPGVIQTITARTQAELERTANR